MYKDICIIIHVTFISWFISALSRIFSWINDLFSRQIYFLLQSFDKINRHKVDRHSCVIYKTFCIYVSSCVGKVVRVDDIERVENQLTSIFPSASVAIFQRNWFIKSLVRLQTFIWYFFKLRYAWWNIISCKLYI